MEHERCVLAGRGQEQVLRSGSIRPGEECGRTTPRQRETRGCSDDTARPVGGVGRECFTKQVGAAALDFPPPHAVGLRDRRRAAEHGMTGDRRLRQGNGRVAVEHRVETVVTNIGARGRAERFAIPLDCEVANACHRAASAPIDSWSSNCSRSSQTMAPVGQRKTASGSAGPPAV